MAICDQSTVYFFISNLHNNKINVDQANMNLSVRDRPNEGANAVAVFVFVSLDDHGLIF